MDEPEPELYRFTMPPRDTSTIFGVPRRMNDTPMLEEGECGCYGM